VPQIISSEMDSLSTVKQNRHSDK